MFSISVCIIVKNEELVLARLLNCIKLFADEIVIVDTGSTDKTKEIAKDFTNKIYDFKWCDDFSAARNFSFSKGTKDYLMWLDADDIITQDNIQKIKQLKSSTHNADIFMCKYRTQSTSYDRERIIKNFKDFKWQGFVHEVIVPCGKIEYTDIEIQHKKEKVADPKRNLKLYQKNLKNGRTLNARELYYYARELFYNNHFYKAEKTFKKFLSQPQTYPPDNFEAHIFLSDCHLKKHNTSKAISILFECLKKHQPTGFLCCKIAYIYQIIKQYDNAIFWFKCALSTTLNKQGFVYEEYQNLIPHIELSKLLFQTDFNSAKFHHNEAKKINPNHPAIVFNNQFFE